MAKKGLTVASLIVIVAILFLLFIVISGVNYENISNSLNKLINPAISGFAIGSGGSGTNPLCTDSDGGLNYYSRGYINLSNGTFAGPDFCVTNTLLSEFYCSGSNYLVKSYICPFGCSNGVCGRQIQGNQSNQTNQTQTCFDSDGGLNYNVAGNVTINNNSASSLYDYCDYNILYESFCDNINGNASTIAYNCSNGCSNGACIPASSNLTIGGPWVVLTQSSTVYVGDTAQFTSTYGNSSFTYDCGQSGNLSGVTNYGTFYCTYGNSGIKNVSIKLGTSISAFKTFNVLTKVNDSCFDTDGGKNYYVKGTYYYCSGDACILPRDDICLSNNTLREGYCNNTSLVEDFNVSCMNGCSNGACIQSNLSCTDTDGYNTQTLGNTAGTYVNGSNYNIYDSCSNNITVSEMTCVNNLPYANITYCGTGNNCYNGICKPINQTLPYCLDTDGGIDYYNAGNLTGRWGDGSSYNYPDGCDFNSSTLVERYCCANGNPNCIQRFDCVYGCSNGACIQNSTLNMITVFPIQGDGYACPASDWIYNYTRAQFSYPVQIRALTNITIDDYLKINNQVVGTIVQDNSTCGGNRPKTLPIPSGTILATIPANTPIYFELHDTIGIESKVIGTISFDSMSNVTTSGSFLADLGCRLANLFSESGYQTCIDGSSS